MSYYIRKKCHTGIEEGYDWHYFYVTQKTLNENVTCPDHPESDTSDFVIEYEIKTEIQEIGRILK